MRAETIADWYPLSPVQAGMLFHNLSARTPGVDIGQILCTLPEALQVAAFERAWQRVVERHEILRTSFHWAGLPAAQQQVRPYVTVSWQHQDWRRLSQPEREKTLEAFLDRERQRGFDLTQAPLMRLALFRIGEADYQLAWTFHHLLLNRRAGAVLLNEVFALYDAFQRGEDLELPPPKPFRDYLPWLETQDPAKTGTEARIVPTQRDGEVPFSSAQERLWLLEQLKPGVAFHNIPIALRLNGTLNVAAFESALNEIVQRHEPLRTAFHKQHDRPAAIADPAAMLTLRLVDLSTVAQPGREAEAQRLVTLEARHPFDPVQSPLLRAKLIRLAADEHLFLLVTHRLACDDWSRGVFYRELAALYETFANDRPSPLPELPIAYSDFARWQREWLAGAESGRQLAYWKQQLGGRLPVLDLPTDRPRPPVQTHHGTTKCFALPPKLSSDLARLSRDEDVTLFMVLLAAFQTLLHRCSNQEEILVGTPMAGRTRVETENLIGFFLNTVVLRGDLSGDPTFRELLKRVRQTVLDACAHQDLPFETLVDALQPERDPSRPPLFQVMFALQSEPLRPLELPGLKLTPQHIHNGTAKYDLLLSLEEDGQRLGGFIEYNTALFDESTITRMLGNFQTLLEGLVAQPAQRLSAVQRMEETGGTIPIGRPPANTETFNLDETQPVPVGVPGEWFIGGEGVPQMRAAPARR